MSQSTVALPSDASASALPFHVLMVPSADQQLQRRHLFEQRLEKDYIARRYKSLQQNPPSQESSDAASSATNGNAPQLAAEAAVTVTMDVWRGTYDVERSLVECCEVPASWEEASNGGALAKGKEVQFLGLLASCCNDVGTRALALTILERSIRKDEKELEEDEQQPRFDEIEHDNDENSEGGQSNDGENSEEEVNNDEGNLDRGSEETTDETVDKGNGDNSSKASSGQEDDSNNANGSDELEQAGTTAQGESQDATTKELNAADEQDQTPSPRSEGDDSQEESEQGSDNAKRSAHNVRQDESGRIDVFLAAGGLSILNHWFKDAISPVVSQPPSSSTPPVVGKKSTQPSSPRSVILKPAPTGPILLPLLAVLEKIPFDKKLVVETKINKQIRKLSKHVDAIVESYPSSEDLTDPVAGGLSVVEVKKAVDALKQTWQEQAADGPAEKNKTADPFAELKKKMAERLEILHRFEAGELPKPEWLARFDQPDMKTANPESKKRKSKTSMTVLQARERQQECMALTKKLKEAQHEKVKLLNQLRERRNKKAEDDAEKAPARKTTKAKKVTWKDGLSFSTGIKVHKLLEQVYHYDPYEFDDEEEDDMEMADASLEPQEAEDQEDPVEDFGGGTTADQDDPMEDDSSDQDLFSEY